MSPRLQPARRGQSFDQANSNRLIAVDSDVLHIKREIESRWPTLEVFFDKWENRWVIVEHCSDGTDRLFFTTPELDQRTVDRCARGDQSASGYTDFLDRIDSHNEGIEKEQERQFQDRMSDFGERFVHALKKDGLNTNVTVSLSGSDQDNNSRL